MAGLIVRKEDGSLLFDTNNITHGLIKSAYLQPNGFWYRFYLRSGLDPNLRSSYTQGTDAQSAEPIYSITVTGVINPFCFLVGPGTPAGSARSGDALTFFFANASTSTKVYVFDFMNENVQGDPPYLKCRREDGTLSFNSLQVPLNVAYTVQAPPPSVLDRFNKRQPYQGCTWENIQQPTGGGTFRTGWKATIDIPLEANVEYAAFINFTRGCDCWFGDPRLTILGVSEGAYGRVGGISFIFGPAGETTELVGNTNQLVPASVAGLPADGNYPLALVIRTANLPFPYR